MIWIGSNSYQTDPEPRPQPLRLRPRLDIGRRANVTSEAHEEKPARSEPGLCFFHEGPKISSFPKTCSSLLFFCFCSQDKIKIIGSKEK